MTGRIHQILRLNDSTAFRYGVAAVATAAALGIRSALDPLLGAHLPHFPFTLAVLVSARFGGRAAGFAATLLSSLGVWYFLIEPRNSFAISSHEAAIGLALFVAAGSLVSLLIGQLHESLVFIARAQDALRRKQQLVDFSHDAIVTADSNRRITGWNVGATEMYGWTEEQALDKVIHHLLRTESAISVAEVDKVLQREGHWDGELSHLSRDGRRLVVESRQVLLRDAANQPVAILEINRDVTARRQAEEELCRAGEQRRLALEAANMGTWVCDVSSGRVSWDERCANIWGEPSPREVAYDDVIARVHPDDRSAIDETIEHVIAGTCTGSYDREYRVIWPDGSVHWVAAHGRVFFEGKRAAQLVGVTMEITARKQAEDRLRQSQKLESIGSLAGGVAHDFNNILTVIMGSASSALADCPKCESSLAILAASKRAAYLTKQLLAYAGKGQFIIKSIDLTDLVSQAETALSNSIPGKAKLKLNLAKGLPCLAADPTRIEQILTNLVTNAGESVSDGSDGLIEVSTHSLNVTPEMARKHSREYDVASGPYVCLQVKDDGDGMDEATLARIFDPFFTTKFTGRGLGLAAVHGIVRSSKGFVGVESSPGAGTTFRIFLPASAPQFAPKTKPSLMEITRQRSISLSTVLVIDDEEQVRNLASVALRRRGFDVLLAGNGQDALDVLADSAALPCVALLDLAMPVMGGDELAPVLEKKYPDMKIIISSGYPEEEARKDFMSSTVAGFLQKPYTVTALAEKVEAVLDPTLELIQGKLGF